MADASTANIAVQNWKRVTFQVPEKAVHTAEQCVVSLILVAANIHKYKTELSF